MARRGQSLVEFALLLPVALFIGLGFLEAAMLIATETAQERSAGVLADWIAAHPDDDYGPTATDVGLGDCVLAVATADDLVTVGATCHYEPRITNGLGWHGLPVSTVGVSAVGAVAAATGTPEASPMP